MCLSRPFTDAVYAEIERRRHTRTVGVQVYSQQEYVAVDTRTVSTQDETVEVIPKREWWSDWEVDVEPEAASTEVKNSTEKPNERLATEERKVDLDQADGIKSSTKNSPQGNSDSGKKKHKKKAKAC